MKKNVSILVAISLFAVSLMFNSCASKPVSEKSEVYEPVVIEGVSAESGNIVVTNLPHFELLSLLCRIAEVPQFTGNYNGGSLYLEQMETLLGKYKDSAIVKTIKDFNSRGIEGDAFISLAYHIKPDFSGTTVSLNPKPDTLHYSWNNIPSTEINYFVKQLHDFALESNFERIYLLNKGSFLNDVLNVQEALKKYKYEEWLSDFFTDGNSQKTYINVSMAIVGDAYYDFALDENNNRNYYISSFPGSNLSIYSGCYCKLYVQEYASENWDLVKEPFMKFFKNTILRSVGDNQEMVKKVEKVEITDFYLVSFLSEIIDAYYLNDAFAEVDEYYGLLDENRNAAVKFYGEVTGPAIMDLIQEYIDNRDTYPDFKAFYPKLNDFILNLPQE